MESLEIAKESHKYWEFKNPNGKKVKCEVKQGAGRISLRKNGEWKGETYILSRELNHPDTVYLNTSSTSTIEDIKIEDIEIEAKAGDSLQSITLQYVVQEQDITNSNGEKAKDPIMEGQKLKVSIGRIEIEPKAGDNLRSIALQYGVKEQDITTPNGEKAKDPIMEGQKLKIPPSLWDLYIETYQRLEEPGELKENVTFLDTNEFNVDLVDEDESTDDELDDEAQ